MKRFIPVLLAVTLSGHAFSQTCPANVKRTTPASRYELQNSGAEVWDKQTDLVWQRCSLGQSWDGSTCAGAPTRHTWQQALEAATAAGGGWMLPDKRELQSLVERGCFNPAINITVFPNTLSSWYWSSSSVASYSEFAWFVGFYNGIDNYHYELKSHEHYVRLVRTRQ
ncbi:MAG: DUF1566 domain-containing protein [Fluviicoccus sp.]|uniref:Lcl C-terminal domain-containing protein n=1 Tax=Fluviicoccus sp. TaxID=2003552 RepID=UPI002727A4BA|nr:DUF1566 domain-containing protein [Fluviicoccus sp.]MDO8330540.1 DUF1566 domain-containing protein [Fluviicoccus sp.]